MAFMEQSWNEQEAGTVYLYLLGLSGDDRLRVAQKFEKYAGQYRGMTRERAAFQVQAYGGLNEHGGLNERGTGNALTILSRAGSSLTAW